MLTKEKKGSILDLWLEINVKNFCTEKGEKTMLIRDNGTREKLVETTLIDCDVNHLASDYIIKNYKSLLGVVHSYGIDEHAEDLIGDVYASILKAEEEGEGFDMSYRENRVIAVGEFVGSRIKKYACNVKYKNGATEVGTYRVESDVVEETYKINADGTYMMDKHGNLIKTKRKVRKSTKVRCSIYAASADDTNEDGINDEMQLAYNRAASTCDDLGSIEDTLSIKSDIETCIDIASIRGVNILNIFKNLDDIGMMLAKKGREKNVAFDKIREVAKNNDEFAEALISVMNYSKDNRAEFEEMIMTY